MWRYETTTGNFAIKQLGRAKPSDEEAARALAIELAAVKGGVPAPTPRLSLDGRCYEKIGGSWVRCHTWADGAAKVERGRRAARSLRQHAVHLLCHGLGPDDVALPAALLLSSSR